MKNNVSIFPIKKEMISFSAELENIIVTFSSRFAGASVDQIDDEINEALRTIVETFDLDRCSLWEITGKGTEVKMSHYYVVNGTISPERVNDKGFPWLFKKLFSGKCVCIHNINHLPEEAAKDKKSFLLAGAKSFMAIPYYIGGIPVAGLTLLSSRHEMKCTQDHVTRIKLMGEIITSAFYRMKMEKKYQEHVVEARRLEKHIESDEYHLLEKTKNECTYEGIIGKSSAMQFVFSRMEQVAPTDSVVLVLGETGTGKGVIARALHNLSRRNRERIVTVNCAALTPNLIESELFGREKGAYTGSTEMQIGRFELAHKGTLILDEFTELPLDLQAKLLRAIQDGEFERLGSPKTIKVDVRILALTSRNLKEEVLKGRFRQDLYYRLNVFPITMPPLRERSEDIPLLVDYYVAQFCRKMDKQIKVVPKRIMAELMKYSWPGNVRELEHVLERAVIVTRGNSLHLAEKLEEYSTGISEEHFIANLAEVEKRHILKVLKKTEWKIEGSKGAAILLGLHPNTLRGRMQKLGIRLQKKPA